MEQKGLVKASMNLPGFVEDAYNSVEAMTKFSDLLLQSKLCPDHFYEKGSDNKPDYAKGKTAAVMMVLLQGHQLNLPPLTALQHIIPVNGLLSVKGDAAKSMIFGSGKLAKDSWKEDVSGSIEQQNYSVTITATRSDNGQTLSRTFSVELAKRAGLWITESQLRGNDGWKYKKSAWYKYPDRMITYRALGFLARDLFPDVMSGIYTTEEAMDLPQDETVVIATESGAEIEIPDKNFSQDRSQSLTSRASEVIDKKNNLQQPMTYEESYPASEHTPPPEEDIPQAPEPQRGQSKTMLNGEEGAIPVYSESELLSMGVDKLQDLISQDSIMLRIQEKWNQKNTNKKMRTIILAHYKGEAISLLAQYDPEDPTEGLTKSPGEPQTVFPEQDGAPAEPIEQEPDPETEDRGDLPWENEDVQPNKGFDAAAPDPEPVHMDNKFGIEVPDLIDGKRAFDQVKALYDAMLNVAGIDNKRFETLITTKFPQFQKYKTRDDFCYKAEVSEVHQLLNSV